MPFSGNIYIENFDNSNDVDVAAPQFMLNWLSEPNGGTLDNTVTRDDGETFLVQKTSTLLNNALRSGQDVSFGIVDISDGIITKNGSLFIDGTKFIEQISNTREITTEIDNNLELKTYGTGDIKLTSSGTNSDIKLTSNKNISLDASNNIELRNTELIGNTEINDDLYIKTNIVMQDDSHSGNTTKISYNNNQNIIIGNGLTVEGDVSATTFTGTWAGSQIADNYILSAATWHAKLNASGDDASFNSVGANHLTLTHNFTWGGTSISRIADGNLGLVKVKVSSNTSYMSDPAWSEDNIKIDSNTGLLYTKDTTTAAIPSTINDTITVGAGQVYGNAWETRINAIIAKGDIIPYVNSTFAPMAVGNACNLGSTSNKWWGLYTVSTTTNIITTDTPPIVKQDKLYMNDILDTDLGLNFINQLQPISYKCADTNNNIKATDISNIKFPGVRRHYGLTGQQVKEVLGDKDFAGYCCDPSTNMCSLRLEEFISPMIKATQELSAKNTVLEQENAELKSEMLNLKNTMNILLVSLGKLPIS